MTILDALRHTVAGGMAVRPGLSIGFQLRGAGGSIWAVDRDPARPERFREQPAAPNNIKHLLAEDWEVADQAAGSTLRSLFPEHFPGEPEPVALSQLFGMKREPLEALKLSSLLRVWPEGLAA